MSDESVPVAIQRLEGRIDATMARIESLVRALETYKENHKNEHHQLAEMVVAAKAAVDRDLHTLNNLDAQMDKERNLLASKDSVADLEKTLERSVATVREHAAKGDEGIDRRVTEFKESIGVRMAEVERQVGLIKVGDSAQVERAKDRVELADKAAREKVDAADKVARDKVDSSKTINGYWITAIGLGIGILGLLAKLNCDAMVK